ncbi:MAG: secretin N-terminal domain-containing protein [bacterium]
MLKKKRTYLIVSLTMLSLVACQTTNPELSRKDQLSKKIIIKSEEKNNSEWGTRFKSNEQPNRRLQDRPVIFDISGSPTPLPPPPSNPLPKEDTKSLSILNEPQPTKNEEQKTKTEEVVTNKQQQIPNPEPPRIPTLEEPRPKIQNQSPKKEPQRVVVFDISGSPTPIRDQGNVDNNVANISLSSERAQTNQIRDQNVTFQDTVINPRTGLSEDGGAPKYITLNFDKADIGIVLQAIADIARVNFIMTPGVAGTITMQTTQNIPVSELFSLMETVLEVNGMATVKAGRYYKIMPAAKAKGYPIDVYIGKKPVEGIGEDTYITHIVPLDYISADDMAGILASFMSDGGNILKHNELNMLIINSYQSNIKRLLKLIEVIDKPIFQTSEELFVYYVENSDAATIASLLKTIYEDKKKLDLIKGYQQEVTRSEKKVEMDQKARDSKREPHTPEIKEKKAEIENIGITIDVEGDLSIAADTNLNALIIKTSPRNYQSLLKTIKKLDVLPREVLIEVLIAEITLDDTTQLGLEWALLNKSGTIKQEVEFSKTALGTPTNISSLGTSGAGLNYVVYKADKFLSLLKAKAEKNMVNILSSPHILASDNKAATISITDSVPIKRETTDENNRTTVTYEYKDAGISLNVTPKINEKGLVSMVVSQEVSNATPTTGGDAYTFSVRKANTSLTVMDGQTIVIGGMIKDQKSKTKTEVPILSKIPLLGYLFTSIEDTLKKTELIILITPHVINSLQDATKITEEFQEKVNSLKKEIDVSNGNTK